MTKLDELVASGVITTGRALAGAFFWSGAAVFAFLNHHPVLGALAGAATLVYLTLAAVVRGKARPEVAA